MAERMNNLPKVLFSRTLSQASWNNTRLMKGDLVTTVRKMKMDAGADMVIMGSGRLRSTSLRERMVSLARHQPLHDECQDIVYRFRCHNIV